MGIAMELAESPISVDAVTGTLRARRLPPSRAERQRAVGGSAAAPGPI
jgi:hypothetical protein